MSKSLENLPERRPSSDEVDPSASTEPPRCCKKGRRSTGAFPENVFLGGAALGEHFSGVFRGHEKGRPVRRPVRCGLWQRLVGHVHRDAGDGADGLAGRLLDGAVDDGNQLDGLIGARLGGNVLKQVARLALEHFANALHGGETHGLDVAAAHARNVHRRDVDALREFVDRHLTIRHHSVETRNNRHISSLTRFRR